MSGVDKANKNISFICKKYYLDNIEHELNNTSTYKLSDLREDAIVKAHVSFCTKFNIDVPDRFLPFVLMLPKFHKPVIYFRYNAAG